MDDFIIPDSDADDPDFMLDESDREEFFRMTLEMLGGGAGVRRRSARHG